MVSGPISPILYLVSLFFFKRIYLAVLGLGCGTEPLLQHMKLVSWHHSSGILVPHLGIQPAPCTGRQTQPLDHQRSTFLASLYF